MNQRVNVSVFGYALFVAVNATSIWEAVFPYLPPSHQTTRLTIIFFFCQSISFCLSLFVAMAASYYARTTAFKRLAGIACPAPLIAGSVCLVVAMYVPAASLALVIGGAILVGIGCAAFFIAWQCRFSSLNPDDCSWLIIAGTLMAPAAYLLLQIVPVAVNAFLIPLVLAPLCGLSLSMSLSLTDLKQPMFEDNPRESPQVYARLCKRSWESALCVAALGLADGVIRAISLADPSLSGVMGIGSMIGTFFAAATLLYLWRRLSFHFDIIFSFRLIFPLIITGFMLLPFLGQTFLSVFAIATSTLFTFSSMLMALHCAQISRNQGANPIFVFGFYAGIVHLLHSLGLLLGYFSSGFPRFGFEQLSLVALLVVYLMALIMFLGYKDDLRRLPSALRKPADARIEFIALEPQEQEGRRRIVHPAQIDASIEESGYQDPSPIEDGSKTQTDVSNEARAIPKRSTKQKTAAKKRTSSPEALLVQRSGRPSDFETASPIQDKMTMRCLVLKKRYRLTDREAEVMELIARGNSMQSIASLLVVSENTVRTHSRHIYAKLNIHKRQNLLDMLYGLNEDEATNEI